MKEPARDLPYQKALKGLTYTPVFLMGFHRSGTTLLYQLLDATSAFSSLTAYHILCYDELLANFNECVQEEAKRRLNQLFRDTQVTDRKLDSQEVHAGFVEEYCFPLENRTGQRQINERSLGFFDEMCRKLRYVSDTPKPLLLKNPWDFPNFLYMKEALPDARFVFIHRHPFWVINSQLHAIRSLLREKNAYAAMLSRRYEKVWRTPIKPFAGRLVYSPLLPLLIRRVMNWVVSGAGYYMKNISALPESDYVSLRYEDICSDLQGQIERILSFLGLAPSRDFRTAPGIRQRTLPLSPDLRRSKGRISSRMRDYFERFGYSFEA